MVEATLAGFFLGEKMEKTVTFARSFYDESGVEHEVVATVTVRIASWKVYKFDELPKTIRDKIETWIDDQALDEACSWIKED